MPNKVFIHAFGCQMNKLDAELALSALRRAGYGLDEAALQAIRAYRFSPALRAGHPVRVRMRWTIQFRLG